MEWSDLSAHERSIIGALMDALRHVRSEADLVKCLDEFVSDLISADCMALCVSSPRNQDQHDFLVAKVPTAFFKRSAEWGHDFVRSSVYRKPGIVLLDTDMLGRKELESSPMYRLSHEVGTPFEQVIAVLLPEPELRGHIGFTGYRLRPRPFSERERALVQHVCQLLTEAVQKYQFRKERALNDWILNSLTDGLNVALLVLEPPASIIKRTSRFPKLVKKWFSDAECDKSGVPLELVAKLASLTNGAATMGQWERASGEETLKVTFTPVEGEHPATSWQLRFEEIAHPFKVSWIKPLTSMEQKIFAFLLEGKSDKEIAPLAGCAIGTVKVHLRSIYRKAETKGRSAIIARALKKP